MRKLLIDQIRLIGEQLDLALDRDCRDDRDDEAIRRLDELCDELERLPG